MLENAIQNHVRNEFAAQMGPIWRNQVGACEDKTGRLIRYGLANDSAKLNASVKSSDLIGMVPLHAFVPGYGWRLLGIFTALEVKQPGFRMDERAIAQARFHDIVRQSGGFAGFVTCPADIYKVTRL